jgi:hypothetical protein
VRAGNSTQPSIHGRDLFERAAPDQHQRLDQRGEPVVLAHDRVDLISEAPPPRMGHTQADSHKGGSDLIGELVPDLHQPRPRPEQRLDAVALQAFDLDLPIPACAHDLGQTVRVVLVALVQTHRQGCLRMPRVNADDRNAKVAQPVPVPCRGGAGLEADAHSFRRVPPDRAREN